MRCSKNVQSGEDWFEVSINAVAGLKQLSAEIDSKLESSVWSHNPLCVVIDDYGSVGFFVPLSLLSLQRHVSACGRFLRTGVGDGSLAQGHSGTLVKWIEISSYHLAHYCVGVDAYEVVYLIDIHLHWVPLCQHGLRTIYIIITPEGCGDPSITNPCRCCFQAVERRIGYSEARTRSCCVAHDSIDSSQRWLLPYHVLSNLCFQ